MTKPQKALIWGPDDLLPKAMEMFLTDGHQDTWEVIRISDNHCISSLAEVVQRIKPDLVILYQAKPANISYPLMKLFQEQPELRVITVSLDNNVMQVYSKHSVRVRQAADLLSVVEDRYFSENSD